MEETPWYEQQGRQNTIYSEPQEIGNPPRNAGSGSALGNHAACHSGPALINQPQQRRPGVSTMNFDVRHGQ